MCDLVNQNAAPFSNSSLVQPCHKLERTPAQNNTINKCSSELELT